MKFLFLALLMATQAFAHEKQSFTRANKMATAVFVEERQHPWPFPLLSIGHNMQSYQNYGSSPYWHDGLDIRSEVDQPIHASAGGEVVNVENYIFGNPLYWEIAIKDEEGFVWKYHHVDRSSIPQEIFDAYKAHKKVERGVFIGNVVRWPISSFGEVYHHLHMLVVDKEGRYINPFLMLEKLADDQAPVISKIGLAQDHRPLQGKVVKGSHALYVEASDLVLHKKFILPPHKISYQLDGQEKKTVWEFIHLPSPKSDEDFINDFYMTGTCGNYTCRKLLFNLNFTVEEPRGQMNLSAGEHTVVVEVEDIVGHTTTQAFSWFVKE